MGNLWAVSQQSGCVVLDAKYDAFDGQVGLISARANHVTDDYARSTLAGVSKTKTITVLPYRTR